MTSIEKLFAGALFASLIALPVGLTLPASAQTQPKTNAEIAVDAVAEPDTDADEATIEDSAILPSAGDQEASRAPSMDLDCKTKPEDCLEPLTTDSPGPTLSTPTRQ